MSAPFSRPLAIEAMERTMSCYLACIDEKEWVRLAGLFSSGATVSMPDYETPRCVSDAIAGFRRSTAGATTIHAAFVPTFEFRDESHAEGRWRCAYRVYRPVAESRTEYSMVDAVGRYENDYELTERGAWSIRAIRLRVERTTCWDRIARVADDAIVPGGPTVPSAASRQ